MKTNTISFISLMLVLVFVITSRGNSQENVVSDTDILVYSVFNYDNGTTLYLYDTRSHESTILYQDDGRLHFAFSSEGLVAFSTDWTWENNGELFILDTVEPNLPLINLSQEIGMVGYPLGWSDDGNYLVFASEIDGNQQAIYVWDGTTTIDITPQNRLGNPQGFDIAWSPDGRLAFTVWFGSSNRDPRSEIYIWDGEATLNLSQNTNAEDREPRWNTNGGLAYSSTLDNEYILIVWDGISYVNGLPDISTYTRIAPQLNIYSPFSTWINDTLLVFEAYDAQDGRIQIYEWDGQIWSNISQIPDVNSYTPQWSQDGHWAFVASEERLYIRDIDNNTIFETHGQSPAWSSGGSLVFCRRNGRNDWNLFRWDGITLSTLIQGDVIYAQWRRSGQAIACSNG